MTAKYENLLIYCELLWVFFFMYLFFVVYTCTPPSIHIDIPSFMTVMMAKSEVMATCSVHTVFNAKVTWQMDGRLPSSNKVMQTRNETHLIGSLTVSTRDWKQLRLVKCKVEHRCLTSAEESIHLSGKRLENKKQKQIMLFIYGYLMTK